MLGRRVIVGVGVIIGTLYDCCESPDGIGMGGTSEDVLWPGSAVYMRLPLEERNGVWVALKVAGRLPKLTARGDFGTNTFRPFVGAEPGPSLSGEELTTCEFP